jgi:glycosyltransferase involved in cell wall biosynthesis
MNIGLLHFGRKGGGARYTLEIARELSVLPDHSVTLLLSSATEGRNDFSALRARKVFFHTASGNYISTIDSWRNYLLPLVFFLLLPFQSLKFVLAIRKLDYLICTMSHPLNIFFNWILLFSKVRYFVVLHEPNADRSIHKRLTKFVTQREVAVCSGLFFLSAASRDIFFEENRVSKPHFILPHGVFRYSVEDTIKQLGVREVKLLFFGRIDKYKGIDLLIKAFEILKSTSLPVSLSIVGSGDLSIFRGVNLLQPGISITNDWIPDEDISQLFLEHDICILPYTSASQSGVIPIASWVGMPVVCTPVGGLKEQVINGVNGFISTDLSPSALATSISTLLNPVVYSQVSSSAKDFSRRSWSWESIVRSMISSIISIK